MSDNRFARRLEELDSEERQIAEAAVEAARASFAGFAEKPGPNYHQAPGLTAEETWTRVAKALAAFERDLAALQEADLPSIRDAARATVRLYAKIIGIHPFYDGNGRTAWAVFSYSLQRCGLVEIAVPPSDATRWALGCALRQDGPQSYEPLTDIVVDVIRGSA